MANILAIDTSSAWCSVALSLGDQAPLLKHEAVSAGAIQLLLPRIASLLSEAHLNLKDLDVIAIGIGPGAFTGVRLGVAVAQGLAISKNIPVIPVCSLDAIAAQLTSADTFRNLNLQRFMVAIDARMEEVYWASYEMSEYPMPKRIGKIHLTKPEQLNFDGIQLLAGSAMSAYGQHLPDFTGALESEISISALGILKCAQNFMQKGLQCDVRELEPLYVRDKVAFTTAEREEAKK
ncbi:tRNA (adenosine(37)-N6)-threonylcarbamoyltransferase complex dimerization subunit type 1 TsaB [Polynucleobacter necessarius]|uniref:tRNA (adenosine(37)-N6)-threonylcarbamoyltransferase complex dimerization subunit type 1 TsaB n=1 Tax=Polynucleobacter necessarius TaxID=576610 RepID=UPI001E30C12D|nr:tRNA (adenosine(37)-N6)-threonylcarbamoyltransferase complex dimerization subunit type 1 TsaB [Polynucleobacter necessarius]